MDPVTLIVIAVLVSVGAGFGAGWGLHPDSSAKALEAQAAAIAEVQKGQAAIAEQIARPVVIDAELKATLAEVPAQCRADMGGDPMSAPCAWATCLQYGQSSAQRPECRAVEALMVDAIKGGK